MQYNYDYFISYAHNDNKLPDGVPGFVNEFVEKLENGSEDHKRIFGGKIRVFFDETEIPDMSHWDNKIRAGLASSRFLIVLLSPNYFKSEYCAKEFDWWMKHEMHRCTLGEGTAPMIISNVGVFDSAIKPAPEIPANIQIRFPNWLSQIQAYQSKNFDMHDFLIAEIDNVLKTLRDEVKDKVRHQEIVENLPYDTYPGYNENFVGRRENLLSLRDYLTTKSGKVITALTGLGGFGKTELALTYGHAFGWDYQLGRFFKSCENCNSIYDAFLTCGILAKYKWELKGTDEEQLLALFDNLKAEQRKAIDRNAGTGNLKTEGAHLLLILDNVNNLDLITQLLKLNLPDFIHVIITTRENTSAFDGIYSESVERLSEDESVELLSNLRQFGVRLAEDASAEAKAKADENAKAEAEAARKIAQLLAGFTLVVELTGKYLYQNRQNPDVTYQSQYERLVKNHGETFQKMADKVGDLTRHAAETVSAVMESTLSAISGNTRKALEFASLMAPDAVALSWLPELCGLNEDEGIDILNELTGYGLLTPLESEPNIARIHRLVADTVKKDIPEDVQKEIIAKIRGKCEALLDKDEKFWCTSENSWNITPVFEFCLALAEQWTVETSEQNIDLNLTWALGTSGGILNSLGKMNEARVVFQQRYKMCEERAKTFPDNGSAQLNLSVSYSNLGDLEKAAGNAAAARVWYEKFMAICQQLADKAPENVVFQQNLSVSYSNLGDLESAAGNAAAARVWYEKAVEIFKQLAEKAPDNVEVQQDLSISYERLGDLENAAGNSAAARVWYEKALEIRKQLADQAPENVVFQQNLS
ncbi:MAG: toll/interleukin-1 receptor domain-containing protein, partial [Thermoguttaceae bacterium]|nr:toll/interleukin-1 receptor domain-containing protein [Thermoguttaceae bacterium]